MKRLALLLLVTGCRSSSTPQPPPAVAVVDPKVVTSLASGQHVPSAGRLAQTLDFVRLGYGDLHDKDVRSLRFETEALSTDDMKQVLALVPTYNAFNGPKVAEALERLRGEISYYQLGREGSAVLYVQFAYWTNQQEKNCPEQRCGEGLWGPTTPGNRRLEPAEHEELVARARELFKGLGADEIGQRHSDHDLRVWWD